MMLRALIISTAAFLCVLSPCMGAPPAGDDLKRMEGTWAVKYAEKGNQPVSQTELKTMQVRITNGTFSILAAGKVVNDARLSVDSSQNPGHLKLASPDGKQATLGIYQLEGGELRLCWDNSPGKRPAVFSGVNGPGSLVYFRLVKAAK